MHSRSPHRFKFTLTDDYHFNYEIIVDVMYLDGNRPVLHVVDTATAFQAARFMENISAKHTWDTLRLCWIDVYQGPPDWIVTDAGTNFHSAEFNQAARSMAISIKEVPIEAHNSIGKIERYHAPLRRAYEIIRNESPLSPPEVALQAAVKAVNDTAGPDGIVPTLLVFGAYPRITDDSAPSPALTQRAEAVRKATKEIRRLYAERQVADALATRNGPQTLSTLDLPISSLVRVWRENDGWKGPFRLLSINGEKCTIDHPRGPKTFRSTVVKPYLQAPENTVDNQPTPEAQDTPLPPPLPQDLPPNRESDNNPDHEEVIHNEIIVATDQAPKKRPRGRPRKDRVTVPPIYWQETDCPSLRVYLTSKEEADMILAVQLRKDGIITTPGKPFELSDDAEINGLIDRGVFRFARYNKKLHGDIRIFKSRIVHEIKNKTTPQPYEKSRLVVQGYRDDGKEAILTQSPTIQRASQRLILVIAPSLLRIKGFRLWLRDITQAYVQSQTSLNRTILAQLPIQIRHLYPLGTIMIVIKPLYGIAEAGTHWWATYNKHHRENLQMQTSTYDPCLLLPTSGNPNFGIIGMQTDDTIGLTDEKFSLAEDEELQKAGFSAKAKQQLSTNEPLIFNGGVVSYQQQNLVLKQKGQGKKLQLIDPTAATARQSFVEQRARGAYIASVCQPEACFDLSAAAQHQDPSVDDIKALNKRIQWQMDNIERGLTFIPLDLATAKIFVFVDGSFANNEDLTSQLGFVIVLANESIDADNDRFTIKGNIVHFSSTKSKRITRSVLASEVYGMVAGVDMAHVISSTIQIITTHLHLPPIPTIVCTDSYSLYECLVKLGTTKEKRLMIDIMALRQSYERRELFEIRWINGSDNPADALTKSAGNKTLEFLVSNNEAVIRMEGWVTRT